MSAVLKNCRLCDRRLVDVSDQWSGRCNNDENCANRVYARDRDIRQACYVLGLLGLYLHLAMAVEVIDKDAVLDGELAALRGDS